MKDNSKNICCTFLHKFGQIEPPRDRARTVKTNQEEVSFLDCNLFTKQCTVRHCHFMLDLPAAQPASNPSGINPTFRPFPFLQTHHQVKHSLKGMMTSYQPTQAAQQNTYKVPKPCFLILTSHTCSTSACCGSSGPSCSPALVKMASALATRGGRD